MLKRILILSVFSATLLFAKEKNRVVSTAHFSTEILLSLHLEDQMVGTAYLDHAILPSLKKAYEGIPVLSKKYPRKEVFYAVKPDFVIGWPSLIQAKNLGPLSQLEAEGIGYYEMKSLESSDIQVYYEDLRNLGKILGAEEKVEASIQKMQKDYQDLQKSLGPEKKKLLVYDSGQKRAYVAGGKGMANFVIEAAGGVNLCQELPRHFGNMNWEQLLTKDPEFIIVTDYGQESYEEKCRFLQEESPLRILKAVKEGRFIRLPLAALCPGPRMLEAAKYLAHEMRKEA